MCNQLKNNVETCNVYLLLTPKTLPILRQVFQIPTYDCLQEYDKIVPGVSASLLDTIYSYYYPTEMRKAG